MVFEKWLPLKWCVVCFLKELFYCYLFIISKSIVLAWVLNTSIVILSFLPHKDINCAHFGPGSAGAGFPGVLECSPERGQEMLIGYEGPSSSPFLPCDVTSLCCRAVSMLCESQGENPLAPGVGCWVASAAAPPFLLDWVPQDTIPALPWLMASPQASKFTLQFCA